MADTTTVVLAAVAAALGAGGSIPELVRWWQKREDAAIAKRIGVEAAGERLVGTLDAQVSKLARRLDASETKTDRLSVENQGLLTTVAKVTRDYARLESEHRNLKIAADAAHAKAAAMEREQRALKEHVALVEARERKLRRKLNIEETGQHPAVDVVHIPRPPPIPREDRETPKPPPFPYSKKKDDR